VLDKLNIYNRGCLPLGRGRGNWPTANLSFPCLLKQAAPRKESLWNLEHFTAAVRTEGMVPCDLLIKRDPAGGNLQSGRWQQAYHARNTHCFWVIVRNSRWCEPEASGRAGRGPAPVHGVGLTEQLGLFAEG